MDRGAEAQRLYFHQVMKPVIAVTMGDPGGVGPEVIARVFKSRGLNRNFRYLLLGIPEPFEILAKKYKLHLPLSPVCCFNPSEIREGRLNFFDVSGGRQTGFDPGKVSRRNAAAAYSAVKIA